MDPSPALMMSGRLAGRCDMGHIAVGGFGKHHVLVELWRYLRWGACKGRPARTLSGAACGGRWLPVCTAHQIARGAAGGAGGGVHVPVRGLTACTPFRCARTTVLGSPCTLRVTHARGGGWGGGGGGVVWCDGCSANLIGPQVAAKQRIWPSKESFNNRRAAVDSI